MDVITLNMAKKYTDEATNEKNYITKIEEGNLLQFSKDKFSYDNKFTITPTSETYISNGNIVKWLKCTNTTVNADLIEGKAVSYGGVSITLNADGSLLFNGTATTSFYVYSTLTQAIRQILNGKNIKITYNKSNTNALILRNGFALNGGTYAYNMTGTETKIATVTGDYQTDETKLHITSGTVFDNLLVKTMIEIAGDSGYLETFEKSTWSTINTNSEITVNNFSKVINIISGNNVSISYKIEGSESDYIDTKVEEIKSENPIYNKTIACIGDSLCYGQGYAGGYCTIIGNIEKNTTFLNLAQGGAQISSNHASGGNYYILNQLSKLTSTPDYIIGEGYVNDYSTNCVLGSITTGYSATLDTTKFYGAMETLCKTFVTTYTSCKYGFIITHSHYSSNATNDNALYITAIKDCCKKWGVPCLDLSNIITPLISANNTRYYTDTLHYNEDGYRKISNMINNWIKTL